MLMTSAVPDDSIAYAEVRLGDSVIAKVILHKLGNGIISYK